MDRAHLSFSCQEKKTTVNTIHCTYMTDINGVIFFFLMHRKYCFFSLAFWLANQIML